jgi:hypothetical protein
MVGRKGRGDKELSGVRADSGWSLDKAGATMRPALPSGSRDQSREEFLAGQSVSRV